jgi:hypothetical protein
MSHLVNKRNYPSLSVANVYIRTALYETPCPSAVRRYIPLPMRRPIIDSNRTTTGNRHPGVRPATRTLSAGITNPQRRPFIDQYISRPPDSRASDQVRTTHAAMRVRRRFSHISKPSLRGHILFSFFIVPLSIQTQPISHPAAPVRYP